MHLVFHSAALGDFVLILPLLRRLRGDLSLVCHWQRGELAQRLLADRAGAVEVLDESMIEFTRLFAPGGPRSLSPMVRDALAGTRSVISFVADGGSQWASNIAALCPEAQLAFAPTRPDATGSTGDRAEACHITTEMARAVQEAGIELLPEPSPLWWRDAPAEAWPQATGSVIVHPGSGGEAKRWPMQRWCELVEGLRGSGRAVRVICGYVEVESWSEGEKARLAELDAELVPHLPGLISVLDEALAETNAVYLGHDAGPTHLAAAMGLATLAVFGPTDPGVWRPVGPIVRAIAPADGPASIETVGTDAVLEAMSP